MTRPRRSTTEVECPFCGQSEELFVDLGGGEAQSYVEDCSLCCRPRVVHVEPGDAPGDVLVWLERAQ
jgi:Cysteine-rich CPXCG